MIKLIIGGLLLGVVAVVEVPEVKVSGALKNIMMKGDLSAQVHLDTLDKNHLFGLGPVAGLKGEIMVLDGKVYTSSKNGNELLNQEDKISQAAMLVYSNVEKWRRVSIEAIVNSYTALEKLIETTAKANGYDTEVPFAFKMVTLPEKANYHVIDCNDGTVHTLENHKQFAYFGQSNNNKSVLLGFYSRHHQSIFTHHTTYMHIHILDEQTKTVGHLDDIQIKGTITIYLPEL